jgi:hypothetical protein
MSQRNMLIRSGDLVAYLQERDSGPLSWLHRLKARVDLGSFDDIRSKARPMKFLSGNFRMPVGRGMFVVYRNRLKRPATRIGSRPEPPVVGSSSAEHPLAPEVIPKVGRLPL